MSKENTLETPFSYYEVEESTIKSRIWVTVHGKQGVDYFTEALLKCDNCPAYRIEEEGMNCTGVRRQERNRADLVISSEHVGRDLPCGVVVRSELG